MVVYYVRWEKGDEPIKQQKGRRKIEKSYYDFTVLCRDCKDAYSCFEYLFMDDIKRPLSLSNLKYSLMDVQRFTC